MYELINSTISATDPQPRRVVEDWEGDIGGCDPQKLQNLAQGLHLFLELLVLPFQHADAFGLPVVAGLSASSGHRTGGVVCQLASWKGFREWTA